MKKNGRRILTVLLGITVCLSLFLIATPAKATLEPDEIVISLGTVASDNFMTISNAFAMADFEHLLTVRIETPGTYYVGLSGYPDALRIRSNTIFDLNGSTLIRAGGMANIIQNVDFNGSRDNGTGYTQTYNFTIKNGTLSGLDGSDEEVNLVNIGHASDVTFDGISFDSCKSHLLELCGCKNVVVKNCSFTSFTGTVASEGKEALQLDICNNDFNPSWNSSYNADNTVCQNITIQNCVFKDYPSAVGNHHTLLGHHSSGIKILNNRFENAMNTTGRAIGCFGFDNSEVKGNIITGKYGYGILVSGGSVSVENNTINNVAYTPLYMTTCGSYVLGSTGTTLENITASTVKGNTLVASGDIVPLSICSGTQVSEVSGNKISTTGNNALSITGEFNGKATQVGQLKNNEITTTATKAKSYGILVSTGAKVNSISENTIQSKLTAIWITSNSMVGSILNNSAVNSSAENGIYVYQSTVNNIKGNKITGSNGYGIRMTGESVVGTIDSNTVNSTDTAIEVNTGSKVTNITNNSMIKSSGKTGIIVTGAGSSATTIKSNNIIGAVNNGIAVMSSGKVGTIDSNTIKGKENAIHVSSSGQITTISANKEITSTTLSGIYVTGGTVSTIKGSTITGTGKYGIGVVSSGKVGTINSCAIQGKE
ncbi:MAG: right-handed parallel beta-helix repeat-containing protein, partial [Clostridia bacterium]|nr:right-handed parallel beta-helix repeat-containing protein [Clostridia bacterium]